MARGFKIDTSHMQARLRELPRKVDTAVDATMQLYAARGEATMKNSAPWQDQTSNARNGLFTKTIHQRNRKYGIVFAHSVPYGIWLEVRWSGKYAVISPTINQMGPEVMKTLNNMLGKIK